VLVLTKTAALGGAERLLVNALPYLDREAYDYRVAVLQPDGPLAEACVRSRIPFAALPHTSALDPRNAWALRGWLEREQIDVLHAHLPLPGALARVAARGLATRVIYTEHNLQEMYRRPSQLLNAATYGWQTRVVAVSASVRDSAAARIGARAARRITVVPNGIDLTALDAEAVGDPNPPLPMGEPHAFRVLVPATLAPRKGQDVLLDAVERGAFGATPIHVWLTGEGSDRRAIEARIRRAPLRGRIHLLGARRDIFRIMRRADVVALPSRFEGHPLALLEAMALGRPVLATRVGGVPEIVEHGRTGLLVPPDDPVALAAALGTLQREPALRARLGAAASARVRASFDVRETVTALESLYRGCLGATPPTGPRGPRARRSRIR
jgi:glycosyltransferase involved in cell wall biosynthesis